MSSVMCLHFSMQEIYINELVNATCHVFALTVNVLTIVWPRYRPLSIIEYIEATILVPH